jgi:hypothetical protein
VPTFADRGVSCGQRGRTPTAINLSFLDWSCYFFFQVAPHLSSWGWVDPVPDPQLLRKIWWHRELNQEPLGLQPGTPTTRPHTRSMIWIQRPYKRPHIYQHKWCYQALWKCNHTKTFPLKHLPLLSPASSCMWLCDHMMSSRCKQHNSTHTCCCPIWNLSIFWINGKP